MADIIVDGKVQIRWATAVANIAAPTTTEWNASLDMTPFIPPDGFQGWKLETQFVDNTKINSKFSTQRVGRANISGPSIMFDKQTVGSDAVWTALQVNTLGFVLVRRYLDWATAIASAQNVQVWPAEVGYRQDVDMAPNALDQFQVFFAVTSTPNITSVIA